ncbi:perlucin-like protein isoform X1 [Oculina patagonica]
MTGKFFKGILLLLFFLCLVCGTSLSQQTTSDECDCCKLLKTVINKQKDVDRKIDEISQQNRNLDKKIDLLLESNAKCSEEGWFLHEKSCFLIINIPTMKWSDARRTCQNLGGDLAIIRSAAENNFIFNLLKKQKTVQRWGVWLGFIRKADNKFYWIDDTPLAGQYSQWGSGNPNNAHPGENCGNIFGIGIGEGKWNDLWCDLKESQLKLAPSVLCQKKSK